MNQQVKQLKIRNILVPLDYSPQSLAALHTAAHLAGAIGARVSGLYVEDADLLEVCRYPFAREILLQPAGSRRLEAEDVERDFRIQAHNIQKMMAMLAQSSQFSWNFLVRRGRVVSEILKQNAAADLTVIGKLGRSLKKASLGSTVLSLVEQGQGQTLILQERLKASTPLLTVFNGSDLALRSLNLSAEIARAVMGRIEVLIPAKSEEEFQKLSEQTHSIFQTEGEKRELHIRFRRLKGDVAPALVALLWAQYQQPIVLPVDILNTDPDAVVRLLQQISNPVLLVRG